MRASPISATRIVFGDRHEFRQHRRDLAGKRCCRRQLDGGNDFQLRHVHCSDEHSFAGYGHCDCRVGCRYGAFGIGQVTITPAASAATSAGSTGGASGGSSGGGGSGGGDIDGMTLLAVALAAGAAVWRRRRVVDGLATGPVAEVAPLLGRLGPLFLLMSLAACRCVSGATGATGATGAPARPARPRPRPGLLLATARCTLRVIVSFAQGGAPTPPDASFLQELSSAARVELAYVRSLTPALHVLVLRADDADDPDCQRALGRLRSDPRVRSADIDQRRQPQR